ncbi:MAG: nodulation protein NfeD [Deltaproteobacteria bacterium]|nr:nodulation protein NfeD [Deltaproteobacteria bacterium]
MALALSLPGRPGAAADRAVVVLELRGAIQPASLRYLRRGLAESRDRSAALTILELDTPGGLLVSLREMTAALTGAERPVAVFVTPAGARAASAGFFLLIAADVAAMAPGTNAGAAHPIPLGSRDSVSDKALEKIASDAAAFARALAEQRGRSVQWAEKAVTHSLSYGDREALGKGLIDLVVSDRDSLIRALDGRRVRRFDGRTEVLSLSSARVEVVGLDVAERILMVIADPNVAYLLLLVGMLGIAIEIYSPGLVVPGALGVLSLLLAFYALSVLPVSLVGVALLVLAVTAFVAEAFVVSYGLLTAGGLVAFVLGSIMLVEGPVPAARVSVWLVLPTALVLAAVVALLAAKVLRARRRPPRAGLEELVGEVGDVVVPLAPEGRVFVHGEYWDAVSPTDLPTGTRVRVRRVVGRRLEVNPAGAEHD